MFNNSDLKEAIEAGRVQLPLPTPLPNSNVVLPYYFIGDAGLPLESYLLTPYARFRHLLPSQRIYNYRLSRARRIVECAFVLLRSKWRVYTRPLAFNIATTEQVILATIALHNFLMTMELSMDPQNRMYDVGNNEPQDAEEENEAAAVAAQYNQNAIAIRDTLRRYFCAEGQLDFQWARA